MFKWPINIEKGAQTQQSSRNCKLNPNDMAIFYVSKIAERKKTQGLCQVHGLEIGTTTLENGQNLLKLNIFMSLTPKFHSQEWNLPNGNAYLYTVRIVCPNLDSIPIVIASNWKPPKCPTVEWMNKCIYLHSHSEIPCSNENEHSTTTCNSVDNVEWKKIHRTLHCMILFI